MVPKTALSFTLLLLCISKIFAQIDVCGVATATLASGVDGVKITQSSGTVTWTTTAGSQAYTCSCPAGTGVLTAVAASTALPTGKNSITVTQPGMLTYGVTAGTASTASAVTITAITPVTSNAVVTATYFGQLCTDLLPGYAMAVNGVDLTEP
jgi:hypothetical protein